MTIIPNIEIKSLTLNIKLEKSDSRDEIKMFLRVLEYGCDSSFNDIVTNQLGYVIRESIIGQDQKKRLDYRIG